MSVLIALARRLSGAFAILGAAAVIAMLVTIVVDVVARQALGIAVPFTVEIVARYYMVAVGFLALAWVDRRGEMIQVELLGPLVSGRLNELFVALLCTAAYAVLAYTTWRVAMREWTIGSFVVALDTRLPVWPSYFIPPIAFALATALGLLKTLLIVLGRTRELAADAPGGAAKGGRA
jgi:TRAP-type C4-dicarboxylate transport system permease small subunit